MITAKLYIPQAHAEVAGMDAYDLKSDYDFKRAVKSIVENCSVDLDDYGYVYPSC